MAQVSKSRSQTKSASGSPSGSPNQGSTGKAPPDTPVSAPGAAGAPAPTGSTVTGTRVPVPGAAGAPAPTGSTVTGTRVPAPGAAGAPAPTGSTVTGTRVPAPGARTAPRSAERKRAHTATSGSKSPARADQLQDHAARLLRQGDELTDWLLAAQAPGQAAQAESRVRDALPVVLEAINLSVTGLDQLSDGRAVHAFEHAQWLDALTTVRNLPWESLPGNQGREKDINAARALSDVRSRLDQLAEPVNAAPVVVEQARAQLILLRAQVKAAQAETGGTPSATWLTEVLAAMVRIVRTIAAGLLAAASAAATQGGDIASQVIAAAVGLAVSAVSAEAGQAARSRWYSPTVATRLDGVHHDLISTVDDLSRYLPRLAPGSSPSKGDTLLVRETQFAALACAYHAKRWPWRSIGQPQRITRADLTASVICSARSLMLLRQVTNHLPWLPAWQLWSENSLASRSPRMPIYTSSRRKACAAGRITPGVRVRLLMPEAPMATDQLAYRPDRVQRVWPRRMRPACGLTCG